MSRLFLFFILLLTFGVSSKAQPVLSDEAQISLLTCGPGDDLYSIFGHSAIRVYDPKNNIDEVFNYGTFDFQDPNFYTKFLRGKLEYWLNVESMPRFVRVYDYLKRSVREEQILLDSIEQDFLYKSLIINRQPENRYYLYDFLFDNCSTRITDILESASGPILYKSTDKKTFRDMLHEYLIHRPWTQFGIDLIIGSRADAVTTPKQQTFLPDYLSNNLSDATVHQGQVLLSSSRIILSAPDRLAHKASWVTTPQFFFILLLLWEFVILRYNLNQKLLSIYDHMWLILMAISSLIIAFMWLGTDHLACGDNYNLLVFSPVFILLLMMIGLNINGASRSIVSLAAVMPYIAVPFVNMSSQNLNPAVFLIALITLFKLVRVGNLKYLQKYL